MLASSFLFANEVESFKPRVRSFSSKERPAELKDHGQAVSEESPPPTRPVIDFDPELTSPTEGHPLGESLVFPKGYRYPITNW